MGMRARVPGPGLLVAGNHRVAGKGKANALLLAWPPGTRPGFCPVGRLPPLLPRREQVKGTARGLRPWSCVPETPRLASSRRARQCPAAPSPPRTQVAVEGPRRQQRLHAELEQLARGGGGGGRRGALGPRRLSEDFLDHEAAVAVRPVVSAALGRPEARCARLPWPLHRGARGSAAAAAGARGPRGGLGRPAAPGGSWAPAHAPSPAGRPGGGTGRGRGARGSAGRTRDCAPAPLCRASSPAGPRHRPAPPHPAAPPRVAAPHPPGRARGRAGDGRVAGWRGPRELPTDPVGERPRGARGREGWSWRARERKPL